MDEYRIKYADRLFYRTFQFKVVLEFKDQDQSERRFLSWFRQFQDVRKTVIRFDLKQISRVFVYTNDSSIIDQITDQFDTNVQTFFKPIRQYQDIIGFGKNSLIRKTLFFKKFRYLVRLNPQTSKVGLSWLNNEIKDYFIRVKKRVGDDYQLTGRHFPILYVKDIDDLMKIKLILSDYITKIEAIVLFDDIMPSARRR